MKSNKNNDFPEIIDEPSNSISDESFSIDEESSPNEIYNTIFDSSEEEESSEFIKIDTSPSRYFIVQKKDFQDKSIYGFILFIKITLIILKKFKFI